MLTMLSTIVCFGAIKRYPIADTNFGMISTLPVSYLIGIGILAIALVTQNYMKIDSNLFRWIQVILLELYLWYFPSLMYPVLPFPGSNHDFLFYPNWLEIAANGHLQFGLFFGQGFPGPYVLMASFTTVLNITNYNTVFQITPLLLNLIVSLFLYVFFRSILGPVRVGIAFICIAIFECLNFTGVLSVYTFFSMGYVYFYFALAMFSLFGFFGSASRRLSRSGLVIMLTLFGALSITHPEIPLVLLGMFFIIDFGLSAYTKTLESFRNSIYLVVSLGIIVLSWIFTGGFVLLASYGSGLREALFSPFASFIFQGVNLPLSNGSQAHILTSYIKVAVVIATTLLAVPSLLFNVVKRDNVHIRIFLGCLGIGLSALLLGNIQGFAYLPRVFAYLLPFFALLIVGTLSRNKKIFFPTVLILLLVISPMFFVTNYSDISGDVIPPNVMAAANYFSHNAPPLQNPGALEIYEFQIIGYYGSNPNTMSPYYNVVFPENQPYQFNASNLFSPASLGSSSYFVLGSNTAQQVAFYYGNSSRAYEVEKLALADSSYAEIYTNPSVMLFSSI